MHRQDGAECCDENGHIDCCSSPHLLVVDFVVFMHDSISHRADFMPGNITELSSYFVWQSGRCFSNDDNLQLYRAACSAIRTKSTPSEIFHKLGDALS